VSIGMFVAPLVVSGTTLVVAQGGLFFAAGIAFVNTTLIARRDLVTPIDRIAAAMDSMACGHVDTDPTETSQRDEVGALAQSFNRLQSYLRTVGGQADALAGQSFDDPVLEEPVPGPFGESIETIWNATRRPRPTGTRRSKQRCRPRPQTETVRRIEPNAAGEGLFSALSNQTV